MTKINRITINSFRNIEEAVIDLKSSIVCFHGQNAQGKTNILESVYLVSNHRSFRPGNNVDYIKKGKDKASVSLLVDDCLGQYQAGLRIYDQKRELLLNSKRVASIRDIVQRLKIVSYVPNSYELVLGDDSERRKFIDRFCFYMDIRHMQDVIYYNKAIKNRNAAIKSRSNYSIWDELIAEVSERIVKRRLENIAAIKPYIQDTFSVFFDDLSKIEIDYTSSAGNTRSEILSKLSSSKAIDEQRGFTNYGPHRDKLSISCLGTDAKKVASTGQAKLIAFLLKIAKARSISGILKTPPVFIYDDVNAFLDEKRLVQLIEIIKKEGLQILSSSVDNNLFRRLFSDSVQFITVSKGRVLNDS